MTAAKHSDDLAKSFCSAPVLASLDELPMRLETASLADIVAQAVDFRNHHLALVCRIEQARSLPRGDRKQMIMRKLLRDEYVTRRQRVIYCAEIERRLQSCSLRCGQLKPTNLLSTSRRPAS